MFGELIERCLLNQLVDDALLDRQLFSALGLLLLPDFDAGGLPRGPVP
jgi:hypothetical protein